MKENKKKDPIKVIYAIPDEHIIRLKRINKERNETAEAVWFARSGFVGSEKTPYEIKEIQPDSPDFAFCGKYNGESSENEDFIVVANIGETAMVFHTKIRDNEPLWNHAARVLLDKGADEVILIGQSAAWYHIPEIKLATSCHMDGDFADIYMKSGVCGELR